MFHHVLGDAEGATEAGLKTTQEPRRPTKGKRSGCPGQDCGRVMPLQWRSPEYPCNKEWKRRENLKSNENCSTSTLPTTQ
jgi:hypothetical protein